MGGEYIIIGHSERRKYHHEDGEFLKSKLKRAVDSGLKVIFCIGESEYEYRDGKTMGVLESQLTGIESDIIIAYEPVWAIGTGLTPTVSEIDNVVSHLKKTYKTVLYGGSVSSANIDEISDNTSVDGFLVGGASTKAEELKKIFA
ncbi:UNVERIFIED_CONTAM: hypothetical protein GTU68_032898 [Idotea baltica]|nr:hypothetical protein [Idotea baltica]